MKRTLIIIIVSLSIILPLLALAANLEIAYPKVGPGQSVEPGGGPVQWVRWIFFLALGLVGVAAVGSLIYAGIVWMTSTSEEKTKDAKSRILSAIVGVLLVIGSVLILQTINPDLTRLRNPTLDPSIFQQPEEGPVGGGIGGTGKCRFDSDCTPSTEYYCVAGRTIGNLADTSLGTCAPKKNTGSCDRSAMCVSGFCDPADKQCKPADQANSPTLGLGATCNPSNDLCAPDTSSDCKRLRKISGEACQNLKCDPATNSCKVISGNRCNVNSLANECFGGKTCIKKDALGIVGICQ